MSENCKPLSVQCQTCPHAQKCTKHENLILIGVRENDERARILTRKNGQTLAGYYVIGNKKRDAYDLRMITNTGRTNWLHSLGYHAGEAVPKEENADVLAGMGYEAQEGGDTAE